MQLKVRYFAVFREAAGIDSEQLETEAKTPADLFAECTSRHSALQNYSASLVAVNGELTHWELPLAEGDEVLFFPPVAGG